MHNACRSDDEKKDRKEQQGRKSHFPYFPHSSSPKEKKVILFAIIFLHVIIISMKYSERKSCAVSHSLLHNISIYLTDWRMIEQTNANTYFECVSIIFDVVFHVNLK